MKIQKTSFACPRLIAVILGMLLVSSLGCGGGGSMGTTNTLTISPDGQVIRTFVGSGIVSGETQFQVALNGTPVSPSNVSWTSTSACVTVQQGFPNCGLACAAITNGGGNTLSATLTATANGVSATAIVTCNYSA